MNRYLHFYKQRLAFASQVGRFLSANAVGGPGQLRYLRPVKSRQSYYIVRKARHTTGQ